VNSSAEYARLVAPLKKGDVVRFLVRRGDGSLFVAMKVE
jgi:serine protease Do